MKLRILVLVFILAAILVGLFLWNRTRSVAFEGIHTSPVLVHIMAPMNGKSVNQGSSISIFAQAWSPNPLAVMELWIDGSMLAAENVSGQAAPVGFSWELEAPGPGVHSFFVRASDSEAEVGQSQTNILNVAAASLQQISAVGGDTLEDISTATGFPVEKIAALNPSLDPTQPLAEGLPVVLPPSGPESDENIPSGPGTPQMIIRWQFTPTTDVNNSYCYQSIGGEDWQRVPDAPFSFLPGGEWLQTHYSLPAVQKLDLLLECWGWQGGTLMFLGEGQTSMDFAQIPEELIISGSGFEAEGLPEMKPLEGDMPDEDASIPGPFALRLAETVAECTSHGFAASYCDQLMNAANKQYNVFIWEWSPGFCWGSCPWGDAIDGYIFWEQEPGNPGVTSTTVIQNPEQKVMAMPLPWGARCYIVKAYIDYDWGRQVSPLPAKYCGGEPADSQTILLEPSEVMNAQIADCSQNDSRTGKITGHSHDFVVGFRNYSTDGGCFYNRHIYMGAVKFDLGQLAGKFAYQATLRFNTNQTLYMPSYYISSNEVRFCGNELGVADTDWSAFPQTKTLDYSSHQWLSPFNYLRFTKFQSISHLSAGVLSFDVTAVVNEWIKGSEQNHGFVLSPDMFYLDSLGLDIKWSSSDTRCSNTVSGWELEVHYVPIP